MNDTKVALVTGASRGIGKAIAETLAGVGMTVIGTATTESGAATIAEYLSASGGTGMALNVTDADSVTGLLKAINEHYGAIDVLVNNAGITRDNLLMRMKDDEWDAIALNYTSGTTGNPKGVVYHHRGAYLLALGNILIYNSNSSNTFGKYFKAVVQAHS